MLAEENIEDYVQTPPVAGGEEGDYLLRVRGDSMKDAGILEGDLVVVRPQETAQDGEIVVALVGEEATVKRFFQEADHVRLQPENDAMEPIRSRDVRVLGKVVGLMRSMYMTSRTLMTHPVALRRPRPAKPARSTSSIAGAVGGAGRSSTVACPVCGEEMEPDYGHTRARSAAAARAAAPAALSRRVAAVGCGAAPR